MSKIDRRVIGFALLCAVSMPSLSVTLEEYAAKQSELDYALLQKKIDEAKDHNKGAGAGQPASAPALPSAGASQAKERKAIAESDDLELVAAYGVGSKLQADVRYKGAIVTVAVKQYVGAWQVESITPYKVVFVKKGGKKTEAYLSTQGENPLAASAGGLPSLPPAGGYTPAMPMGR